MSDYSSKKVAELKELLSARGLAVSGNKADLVARSTEAITVEDDVEETVVELSDEDKQKQAIEDLEKQIKRKKRFATGDNDADIAELEKQLERIKRFGVTAVATNDLSLDKGLDTLAKGRRKESGKVRRESVSAKDKNTAHPYNKSENGLKPGVKIATVDEEKIKARQARFSQ
ncbi:hypothetical protein BD777DRAFT_42366 [Yarrowia lipolytica]|nr:hypothetical protein BD777DRAFT_42366 [Yarrowia lipolytica]